MKRQKWFLMVLGSVLFLTVMFTGMVAKSSEGASVPTTVFVPQDAPQLDSSQYHANANMAANYLLSHYNGTVGLVYESEDEGKHWLSMGELPNYALTYQQTYWAYSDNLFASLALAPFNRTISENIAAKISMMPNQGEFLVLNGTIIREYRTVQDFVVEQGTDYAIITRTYTGTITQPALGYADELMYYALNQHLLGNTVEAKVSFQKALDMWNGTCFVDEAVKPSDFNGIGAPTDSGYCANNRIGLALFVGKVLKVPVPSSLETVLWSMQLPNGGIASLSQNGKPLGTANCESTALSLLQFNTALIATLQG